MDYLLYWYVVWWVPIQRNSGVCQWCGPIEPFCFSLFGIIEDDDDISLWYSIVPWMIVWYTRFQNLVETIIIGMVCDCISRVIYSIDSHGRKKQRVFVLWCTLWWCVFDVTTPTGRFVHRHIAERKVHAGSLSSNLASYYLPTLFHEWTKKTQNQKPSPNHLAQNGFLASIYNIINQRFAVEKPWFDGSDNSLCKTTGFVTKHSTLEQQHNTKQTKQPIPTRPWRTTSTTTILPI